MLEALHVAVVRAAPAVNRLVRVADHEDVTVRRGEMFQQSVLGEVGILELVHEHVGETLGVFLAHSGEFGKKMRRPQQQIVEIYGIGGFQ